jgi:hypothetical protein
MRLFLCRLQLLKNSLICLGMFGLKIKWQQVNLLQNQHTEVTFKSAISVLCFSSIEVNLVAKRDSICSIAFAT